MQNDIWVGQRHFANILCTDEVKMEFFGHSQKCVRREKGAFDEKNTLPSVEHGGGDIVVWGSVAATGTRYIAQVDERMNSTKY